MLFGRYRTLLVAGLAVGTRCQHTSENLIILSLGSRAPGYNISPQFQYRMRMLSLSLSLIMSTFEYYCVVLLIYQNLSFEGWNQRLDLC